MGGLIHLKIFSKIKVMGVKWGEIKNSLDGSQSVGKFILEKGTSLEQESITDCPLPMSSSLR